MGRTVPLGRAGPSASGIVGKNRTQAATRFVMRGSDRWSEELFRHYGRYVAAYAKRRVASDLVDDVVSEVFFVAWRRRSEVPADALPWLYGTARHVIGTRYRSADRWRNLVQRLANVPSELPAEPADVVAERSRFLSALGELSEDDRELLMLLAWEGLDTNEIASAARISPGSASVRIHRARRRLQAALEPDTTDVEYDHDR